MRNYYIAGNWKMNKTTGEAVELAGQLVKALENTDHTVMIAPTFTALKSVSDVVKGSNILLGAQNMSNAKSGAHTGEISIDMLKDCGVNVVILGHSERRLVYGESDQFINEKVKLACAEGMDLILCVGETLEQREAGEAVKVVTSQLEKGLDGINESELDKITIAYEPVWAIGTGKTATPQDADDIHKVIRDSIAGKYNDKAANEMIIQYGGSVKPANVKDLMAMKNIDGALVGGASLKSESFIQIATFDK